MQTQGRAVPWKDGQKDGRKDRGRMCRCEKPMEGFLLCSIKIATKSNELCSSTTLTFLLLPSSSCWVHVWSSVVRLASSWMRRPVHQSFPAVGSSRLPIAAPRHRRLDTCSRQEETEEGKRRSAGTGAAAEAIKPKRRTECWNEIINPDWRLWNTTSDLFLDTRNPARRSFSLLLLFLISSRLIWISVKWWRSHWPQSLFFFCQFIYTCTDHGTSGSGRLSRAFQVFQNVPGIPKCFRSSGMSQIFWEVPGLAGL